MKEREDIVKQLLQSKKEFNSSWKNEGAVWNKIDQKIFKKTTMYPKFVVASFSLMILVMTTLYFGPSRLGLFELNKSNVSINMEFTFDDYIALYETDDSVDFEQDEEELEEIF